VQMAKSVDDFQGHSSRRLSAVTLSWRGIGGGRLLTVHFKSSLSNWNVINRQSCDRRLQSTYFRFDKAAYWADRWGIQQDWTSHSSKPQLLLLMATKLDGTYN
jgi:hypothetical protein